MTDYSYADTREHLAAAVPASPAAATTYPTAMTGYPSSFAPFDVTQGQYENPGGGGWQSPLGPGGPAVPNDYSASMTNWGSSPALPSVDYLTGQKQYGTQRAIEWGAGQNALDSAVAQSQRAGMGLGIQAAEADLAFGTRWANTDADFERRRNALKQAGIDIDVGANARQPGYLTALHNLALGGLNARAGEARRGLESDLTHRGAFTSVGGQQGRYDIATELLRQTQGENVDYGERMARTADEKKTLDLRAKDLGISGEQLESDLAKGLQRMGLDRDMTVADLFNKMQSSNLQEAAQANKVYQDAITNYSDYFSRLYQGPNAAAGAYDPALGAGPSERTYGGRR